MKTTWNKIILQQVTSRYSNGFLIYAEAYVLVWLALRH